MTQEQQKFYDIKHFSGYKTVGEDIDYAVLVNHSEKEVVLLFEESTSSKDWIHNFRFIPYPVKLDNKRIWTTRGYACAYSSAKNIPIDLFCQEVKNYPSYRKVIRGWSFGSAMAKIAMKHFWIREGVPLDEVTTYGDVACLFNPFSYKINRKCAKQIREYCAPNDFVTWMVPFQHRNRKCRVGDRFSLIKIFKTKYWHTNYDLYDYSEYEKNQ